MLLMLINATFRVLHQKVYIYVYLYTVQNYAFGIEENNISLVWRHSESFFRWREHLFIDRCVVVVMKMYTAPKQLIYKSIFAAMERLMCVVPLPHHRRNEVARVICKLLPYITNSINHCSPYILMCVRCRPTHTIEQTQGRGVRPKSDTSVNKITNFDITEFSNKSDHQVILQMGLPQTNSL